MTRRGMVTMTCKIDRHVIREDLVLVRITGRVTGENVNTLRALLEQENAALTIDLKDVRLVDDEAVKLLAIHESNGAKINNCPLYIREWITREREAK
jgi:anti-anti-sigma regulatory factor